MKHCPFCAEEIQDAAIVCKHCGRDLKGEAKGAVTVTPARKRSSAKTFLWIVGLAAAAFVAYQFWSTNQQVNEVVDGFLKSGVLRSYSCGDRVTPSASVTRDWSRLSGRTQKGVLNAIQMVCSTTATVNVQEK